MSEIEQFERGGCSGEEVDSTINVHDADADERDEERDQHGNGDSDAFLSADGVCYSDDTLPKDLSIALSKRVQQFCSVCRTFIQESPPVPADGLSWGLKTDYIVYHRSLISLKGSVDTGCSFCEDISRSLDDLCNKARPPIALVNSFSIKYKLTRESREARLGLYLHDSNGSLHDNPVEFKTHFFFVTYKLQLGPGFLSMSLVQRGCISVLVQQLTLFRPLL